MKPQFLQKFSGTFLLWFQNYLNKYGETYSTQEVVFKKNGKHPKYTSFISYVSDFPQISADLSLPNTVAPIYIGDEVEPINRPSWFKATMIDYQSGCLLVPDNAPQPATISVECSPQEFSVFFSPLAEGEIILNILEDRQNKQKKDDGLFPTPLIVLCIDDTDNTPGALGGLVNTNIYAKAIVFADNPYFLDGVLSIFNDSVNEVFRDIDPSLGPFSELGVLKEGKPYNYLDVVAQTNVNNMGYYVEKAVTSKTNDLIRRGAIAGLKIGFIEFEISTMRYRQDY